MELRKISSNAKHLDCGPFPLKRSLSLRLNGDPAEVVLSPALFGSPRMCLKLKRMGLTADMAQLFPAAPRQLLGFNSDPRPESKPLSICCYCNICCYCSLLRMFSKVFLARIFSSKGKGSLIIKHCSLGNCGSSLEQNMHSPSAMVLSP